MMPLLLHEITHATLQALGGPMPNPRSGDKRLRAPCEADLRAPVLRATLAEWTVDASDSAFSAMFKAAMGQPPRQFMDKMVCSHCPACMSSYCINSI